ncbi:MAG: hypothetical protein QME12_00315 [Nanoarchaeota archaeon]|nr:hypothetical protein [Nanoarchaeota archaeon]
MAYWVKGMLDDKRLKEIGKNVPAMLKQGELAKDENFRGLANFYLDNALVALNTARLLEEVSAKKEIKRNFPFLSESFESYLWIINTSYYSMFYMAGALLAGIGIKVKSEIGVHKKTFDAFAYYFYLTKKIAKHYLEEFEEAQEQSAQLLGTEESIEIMQRKAKELIAKYDFEMGKRGWLTYNIGEKAKESKAQTSLKRAVEFYNECLKIIPEINK